MNQQRAKALLPIITAFAEGKTIQTVTSSGWSDVHPDEDLTFNGGLSGYRIKPQAKMRPWEAGEAPIGAWLKEKGEGKSVVLIMGQDGVNGDVLTYAYGKVTHVECEMLFEKELYSTDNGATWHICGTLDTEATQ